MEVFILIINEDLLILVRKLSRRDWNWIEINLIFHLYTQWYWKIYRLCFGVGDTDLKDQEINSWWRDQKNENVYNWIWDVCTLGAFKLFSAASGIRLIKAQG